MHASGERVRGAPLLFGCPPPRRRQPRSGPERRSQRLATALEKHAQHVLQQRWRPCGVHHTNIDTGTVSTRAYAGPLTQPAVPTGTGSGRITMRTTVPDTCDVGARTPWRGLRGPCQRKPCAASPWAGPPHAAPRATAQTRCEVRRMRSGRCRPAAPSLTGGHARACRAGPRGAAAQHNPAAHAVRVLQPASLAAHISRARSLAFVFPSSVPAQPQSGT